MKDTQTHLKQLNYLEIKLSGNFIKNLLMNLHLNKNIILFSLNVLITLVTGRIYLKMSQKDLKLMQHYL